MRPSLALRLIALFLAASIAPGCYRWAPVAQWESERQAQSAHFSHARVGHGRSAIEFGDAELTGSVLSGTDRSGTRVIVDMREHDDVAVRKANWIAISGITAGATVSVALTGMLGIVVLFFLGATANGSTVHPTPRE